MESGTVPLDPSILSEVLPVVVELADNAGQDAIRRASLRAGLSQDKADEHSRAVALRDPVKRCAEKCLAIIAAKYQLATEFGPEMALTVLGLTHLLTLRSELAAIRAESQKKPEPDKAA